MTGIQFTIIVSIVVLMGLTLTALPTIIIDPLFHYHKPLKNYAHKLSDERYQNNGIVRHFEYDAMITGTSMTENFKTTELDELFGVQSIKVPYAGGSYKEISDNINVALKVNSNLEMILCSLDLASLIEDKDAPFHRIIDDNYIYPWYIVDDNPFTDVSYIFNKEILLNKTLDVFKYTGAGGVTTTFDQYVFWEPNFDFGKEAVLTTYHRPEKQEEVNYLTDEDAQIVKENVRQNIVNLALKYPDVMFYVFVPPYSICYWDFLNRNGQVERNIKAMEIACKELIMINNIKIYIFGDRKEIVCNLDNYKDMTHYKAAINSEILQCIKHGKNLISEENFQDYFCTIRELYLKFDYDSIFE